MSLAEICGGQFADDGIASGCNCCCDGPHVVPDDDPSEKLWDVAVAERSETPVYELIIVEVAAVVDVDDNSVFKTAVKVGFHLIILLSLFLLPLDLPEKPEPLLCDPDMDSFTLDVDVKFGNDLSNSLPSPLSIRKEGRREIDVSSSSLISPLSASFSSSMLSFSSSQRCGPHAVLSTPEIEQIADELILVVLLHMFEIPALLSFSYLPELSSAFVAVSSQQSNKDGSKSEVRAKSICAVSSIVA
jgi:hypothetical protein